MVPLSRIIRLLLVLWVNLLSQAVQAGTDVRVVGLFSERAVVVIDGRQHVLKVGQTTPEGVRLIAADSESALFEIDGEEVAAQMDGRVTARKRTAQAREFQISRNAAESRRLGIDYRVVGSPMSVTTASGVERAWGVNLDTVKVGELELRNVGGVVLEGEQPATVLLGMSYLGRLEMTNSGSLMTLRKKY